ncbi:MAG: PilN domain-containing protein [Candidatus Eisenbacteria bacterium]|nr:PilN domain-containing protein [Candidatus Eisenbacteria bacterium]
MIKINVLPIELRTKKRVMTIPHVGNMGFVALVGGVVALIIITSLVEGMRIGSLKGRIAEAEGQAAQLRPQIEQIERLTAERAELDAHMRVITELENSRAFEVMLLAELNKRIPEHLWLTSYFRSDPNTVVLEGVTFSNLIVADFMTRLERSVLFQNVDLTIAERGKIDEMDVVKFSLSSGVRPE